MNILIVSPVNIDEPGGVASHVKSFMEELKRQNNQVELIVPNPKSNIGKIFLWGGQKILNKLCEPFGFSYANYIQYMLIKEQLKKMLKKKKIEIIHCQCFYTNFVTRVLNELNMKIPIILTVHGYITFEAVSRKTIKKDTNGYQFLINYERDIYSSSDSIICVDERLRNHVKDNKSNDNIQVIINAVDTGKFTMLKKKQESIVIVNIICPRVLNPKNGVIYLVKAINILVHDKNIRNIKLFLAGDGKERVTIENYINENELGDYITMLGYINHNEMPLLYKKMHISVIPSINSENVEEATSIAALESMASGLAIIASEVGGLKLIIDHEKNGILVNERNEAAIADAIEELVFNNKKRIQLGINARRTIEEKFSEHAHTKIILNLYNNRNWVDEKYDY